MRPGARPRPSARWCQVDPHQGAAPSEATEVRILYDADQLYIGVHCFDREPGNIIGTQMGRDADLGPDDRVELVIDTFHDQRNAFYFKMNPVGAKVDGLISNNGQDVNLPWNGIWEGKASIDDQGWSVELAIPFKTLSFRPGLDTWGFNLNRIIKRRLETDRWSGARQDFSLTQVAQAGDLCGLTGMRQGTGLDVVPFFVATWTDDREDGPDKTLLGQAGLDVFYRLTPSLRLSLTFNTDFAQTEVDDRQINLTRFALFFPEKRDFFLEDAGIFQFADLGSSLIPFFSRRIGLDIEGRTVPLLAGAKLTGRVEDFNIGVLDVVTDATNSQPEKNLFVTRISKNIGEQSTVGGIFTSGNPESTDSSRTFGLDYNYRTSSFLGDKNLTASIWGLQTQTEAVTGGEQAWGASLSSPNDTWDWRVAFKDIGENFDPALGFVPRRGIRTYDASVGYAPRLNGTIRQLFFGIEAQVVTDREDHVESAALELRPLGLIWDAGDELRFELVPTYESLDAPFEIMDGVTIAQDDYSFLRYRMEFESALKRPVSGSLAVEAGDFFDGQRTDVETSLEWRASRHFTGSIGYEQSRVDLPAGDFTTHLGRVRADIAFTPELTWSNFVQFDNESDSLGINSRWRWTVRPGQDLFLVFDESFERSDGSVEPLFELVAFKIEYTLRF
jgi:hypothetical protein